MAFDVFNSVLRSVRPYLGLGEYTSAFLLCALVVLGDIVHVNQHAVDDPGHSGPPASSFTVLTMSSGALIVGTGRRQLDNTVAGFHLAVSQPAVVTRHTSEFPEAECFG